MKRQEQSADHNLPPIPDYPDAPLPAWKHYGITNYADRKTREELTHAEYQGYMIGLEIAYALENEKVYSMRFGETDMPENALQESESREPDEKLDEELPFTDEFLSGLYGDIGDLILSNTPDYSGEINPELTIAITGSKKVVRIMCRVPDECPQGHSDRRICKSVNYGPWRCISGHPRCG